MRRRPGHPLLRPASALHGEFLMQGSAQPDDPQIPAGAPLGTRRILYLLGGMNEGRSWTAASGRR